MKKNGFTLIELLIVIAIIGLVAAIAVPNLLIALQKSRVKATMGDLKTLGTAVESYIHDNNFCPQTAAGDLSTLRPILTPFHIKNIRTIDAWGIALRWDQSGNHTETYSITSYGRDHIPGGPLGNPSAGIFYDLHTINDFDNDIVFNLGQFSFAPRF